MTSTGPESESADPLAILVAPPPCLEAEAVRKFVNQHYGFDGELEALLSERDQNFRLSRTDGSRFVVKIANREEPRITTDFQIQALLHLEQTACSVPLPRVVRTLDGAVAATIETDGQSNLARIVTYLPGTPAELMPQGPELARSLGAALAALDVALAGFTHPGERQALLWDLQQAPALAQLLHFVAEPALRARVQACLQDYEQRALNKQPLLRRQVIHSDLNAANALIGDDGRSIAGIIDFGDMVSAPLINDVAIGASYLRVAAADPLELVAPFVVGFNDSLPLTDVEIALLFDLIRTRLAATITILRWRVAERGPDEPYARASLESERSAEQFLEALDALSRPAFTAGLRAACGR